MTRAAVVSFYAPEHIGLPFGWIDANHKYGHSGLDIKGHREGTWIPSYVRGTVVRKLRDEDNPNDLGNYITVEVPGVGWFSFCHLASLGGTPNVGDPIILGQGIGPLGDTGYSFGPHLHTMFSTTSSNPNTRRGIANPLPFVIAARTAAAGGGYEPVPDDPTPTPAPIRKRKNMDRILRVVRPGVGVNYFYITDAGVQMSPELSMLPTTNPQLLASEVAYKNLMAYGLGITDTLIDYAVPELADAANLSQLHAIAWQACRMPKDYPITPSNPFNRDEFYDGGTDGGSFPSAAEIASQVGIELSDDFDTVNDNIAAIPTHFVVTPAGA